MTNPANTTETPATTSSTEGKRDRKNGQYVHTVFEALCTCGHTLGVHAAATVGGKRPCFCSDFSAEECSCEKYKKAKTAK